MPNQSKLAVILHADVAGSTALVQRDEQVAHDRVRAALRSLAETVADHDGTTHELRGDALVAEFARASDAVSAALAYQADDRMPIEESRDGMRVRVRIGIAMGEVVVADDTVTGSGVVLAQRIEQLAGEGGVCVSAAVHEALPRRLPLSLRSLGDRSLKGFDEPMRVYAVVPNIGGDNQSPDESAHTRPEIGGSATIDRPSIAILPFHNLSGDPDQAYFADGMTEDIITGLSRFRSVRVTARSSTFVYRTRPYDVRTIASELGVKYVIEGSVRRRGERIRITVQLIDGAAGNHLWAERYDRELEDLFSVQDEVTEAIVAAVEPEIGDVERERARRSPPGSVDAWSAFQRGLADYYASSEVGLRSAIRRLDHVTELAPAFAPAFAMAANARWRYVMHFDWDDLHEYLDDALRLAYRAIEIDPRDATGLWAAGRTHSMLGQHDLAVLKVEEALRLNSNDALVQYFMGSVLRQAGRLEEAISYIDRAIQLSPRDQWMTGMLTDRAFVLFALERFEEALPWAQRARLNPNPRTMTFAVLAGVLSKLGRSEEAGVVVRELVDHAPNLTCSRYRRNPFGTPDIIARLVDALSTAGLPE